MTMIRTHFSTTTGKRERCTATVRGCRFSDHQEVETNSESMADFYAAVPAAAYASITHPVVHHALTADLNYSGPKPSWWDKHEAEVAAHPKAPTTVQLLDVIETPAGKVAVVWQETSHRDNDMGVILDSGMGVHTIRYLDFESGEPLGYVNLGYMNAETIKRSFGDDEFAPFRHAERFGGSSLGMRDYSKPDQEPFYMELGPDFTDLEGEELLAKRREVWLKAHGADRRGYTKADGTWLASYQLSKEHIPDDETVAKDLKVLRREFQRAVNSDLKYFNRPFVDFSRVEGALGGRGYGSALYIYAARFLATRDQVLRGSGLQSDEAQGVWKRFAQQIPQHVKKVTLRHRNQQSTMPTLDFRA